MHVLFKKNRLHVSFRSRNGFLLIGLEWTKEQTDSERAHMSDLAAAAVLASCHTNTKGFVGREAIDRLMHTIFNSLTLIYHSVKFYEEQLHHCCRSYSLMLCAPQHPDTISLILLNVAIFFCSLFIIFWNSFFFLLLLALSVSNPFSI